MRFAAHQFQVTLLFKIPVFHSPLDGPEFDIRPPRSTLAVTLAALAILAMATLGFIRGMLGVNPAAVSDPLAAATNGIAGAKPAAPVAQNPSWSVLSGPSVSSAPTSKAPTPDASATDDSDTDDDQDDSAADTPPAPVKPVAPVQAATSPAGAAKSPAAAPSAAPEPPPY